MARNSSVPARLPSPGATMAELGARFEKLRGRLSDDELSRVEAGLAGYRAAVRELAGTIGELERRHLR